MSPLAARHADMQIICKSAVRESAGGRGAGDPGRTISCAARAGRLLFTDAEPVIGAEGERERAQSALCHFYKLYNVNK